MTAGSDAVMQDIMRYAVMIEADLVVPMEAALQAAAIGVHAAVLAEVAESIDGSVGALRDIARALDK